VAVVVGMACAVGASAGLSPVRTSTLIVTSASVYEDRDVSLRDSEQVSAGTPWVANLDAEVEHVGVSAFASADSVVDWNNFAGILTHDIALETSLMRTSASAFHRADAYAAYMGTMGLDFDQRTTLTLRADASGDAGWGVQLYRLEPDISYLNLQLAGGDTLTQTLTLDAGFYILSTDSWILSSAVGVQSFDRFESQTGLSLSIVIPAPFTAAAIAPLMTCIASRRRQEVTR
jgi:hypothetical protein